MAAKLPDIKTLLQAGIDPKTRLPIKVASGDPCALQSNVKMQLRILDEQNAVNRYVWYNLPNGLDGQMIERIIYYKGQAAFFYMKANNTFYFLPYALDGTIDVYGRFLGITPLPFGGNSQTNEKGKIKPWIEGMTKRPIYDVVTDLDEDTYEDGCVILRDYTPQLSETIISRQIVQDPLLDAMSEVLPLSRTSLIANCGTRGVRVQDETQAESVNAASRDITQAALHGETLVALLGTLDFQELTGGTPLKSEEYLLFLQALDNYRLSLYGLSSGGLFQKKSHMLEAEMNMNSGHAKSPLTDGLTIRQKFCDIVNSIWGLGIWCEVSETAEGVDKDGDGETVNNQDQSGIPGEQPEAAGGNVDE